MGYTREVLLASSKEAKLHQLGEEESKALKELLIEMYIDVINFCEENNICIMLGGGSVLGSVRHKGFIPWDDDLDLMMARADYMKFAQLFEKSMGDKYELFVPDGNHRITNLFMKISRKGTIEEDIFTAGSSVKTGVSIDVFPMENVPKSIVLRKIKGFISNVFAYTAVSVYMFQNRNEHMKVAYSGTRAGKRNYSIRIVLGALFSFRSYEKWYVSFDRFVQSKPGSGFCTIPTGRMHYHGELQSLEFFFPPRETTFEGVKAYVPREVEAYLECLYGNYMELPSEEQREKHFYTKIQF